MTAALRTGLLALSRNRTIPQVLQRLPLARRLPRRFVAGETLERGLRAAAELHQRGFHTTLNHLGEEVTSAADAGRAAAQYLEIVDALSRRGMAPRSQVALKLTHLGLHLGTALCRAHCRRILDRAHSAELWVELDMEGSAFTDRTLELYHQLHQTYPRLGVALQAYLYRSPEDLEALIRRGAKVRLCKGAYDEPASIAHRRRADVDPSYIRLMERLFSRQAGQAGALPAIATHDSRLIEWIEERAERGEIDRHGFEFQMLYGIRRDLQEALLGRGYRTRIYIPFGQAWYPYFVRRLAERPANLLFLLRQLAGG